MTEPIGWLARCPDGTRAVPIYRRGGLVRGYAFVDEADFALASKHRWYLDRDGYAMAIIGRWPDRGTVKLHRLLMGDPLPGFETDHANRDRLDNRRSNLRWRTRQEQNANTSSQRGSTSRYRGVSRDTANSRWQAHAMLHGRRHWLGRFSGERDAYEVVKAFWAGHGVDVDAHNDRPCKVGAVWAL